MGFRITMEKHLWAYRWQVIRLTEVGTAMKAARFHGLWSWAEWREKLVCLCYAYRLRPETTCGSGFSTSPRMWVQRIDTYLSAVCLIVTYEFLSSTQNTVLKSTTEQEMIPYMNGQLQLLLSPPTPALHPCWDIQPSGEETGRGGGRGACLLFQLRASFRPVGKHRDF